MCRQSGFWAVLILIFMACFSFLRERSVAQVSPVLLSAAKSPSSHYISLCGSSFAPDGQCVIVSDLSASAIVAAANTAMAQQAVADYLAVQAVESGQVLTLHRDSVGKLCVDCAYMPAGQCITLGIALHPDHMSELDWQALPGIGAGLAQKIVADRKVNGDFRSFSRLGRVHGIGSKTLARLRAYF
jgi:competence protein ComEA